jgi:hypothetical protein
MARHSFPGHGKQPNGGVQQPPASGSLVAAIDALTQAVALLAERLGPSEPTPPVPPSPPHGRRGRHLRLMEPAGEGESPWDQLSVVELRALLRDYPIDRTSLPAPIENLRRAELVEALRQLGALGYGAEP